VGSYDYRGWSVAGTTAASEKPYSVIELYMDSAGHGTGNLSLATDVVVDEAAGTVSLAHGGSAGRLLTGVRREPRKP